MAKERPSHMKLVPGRKNVACNPLKVLTGSLCEEGERLLLYDTAKQDNASKEGGFSHVGSSTAVWQRWNTC